MRKILFYVILLLGGFGLNSCEEYEESKQDFTEQDSSKYITLEDGRKLRLIREREKPFVLFEDTDSLYREIDKQRISIVSRSADNDKSLDNLGGGFKPYYKFPIENPDNISYPVVNVSEIYNNPSTNSYIHLNNLLKSTSKYSTFASSDSYYSKSEVSEKVSTNTSVGLSSSIGASVKTTYSSTFSHSSGLENKTVYGELSIYFNQYNLSLNSGLVYDYSEKYITPGFRSTLYNNRLSNTLCIYGTHVLMDYSVGGSAAAMYRGTSKMTESVDKREENLEVAIEGSYGFNKTKVTFNTSSSFMDSIRATFSNVEISVRTIGGSTGHGITSFSSPENLSNVNVDLSSWAQSINNNNSVINRINNNGLVPISDFILEDNFKKIIERQIENFNRNDLISATKGELLEPIVTYGLLVCPNKEYIATMLSTRHESLFLIGIKEVPAGEDGFSYLLKFLESDWPKNGYYDATTYEEGLFIGLSTYIQEEFLTYFPSIESFRSAHYDLSNVNESSIKLCKIPSSDMKYLTFTSNNKKFALGIYADFIFDTYGLEEYRNLPVQTISSLRGYTVLGL